jgi:hypothetical protein
MKSRGAQAECPGKIPVCCSVKVPKLGLPTTAHLLGYCVAGEVDINESDYRQGAQMGRFA